MWFAVLGPLLVDDGAGGDAAPAAVRLRVLLAALLLHANTPLSGDALAEVVWDGAPPPGFLATLRSHVRRLRRALGPAAGERIEARDPGYLIRVDPAQLDVLCFEALCRDAGAALRTGAWARAADAAVRALELWRGAPLLDIPSQVLRDGFVPRLEQLHAQVLEDHAEAGLALGRHGQLVQPLRELAVAHPLREQFHAQLMLALYRCGRQAEALAAYQDARRVLVEQLGIEPGARLRRLHERILAGDETDLASSAPAEHPAPSAGPHMPAPRQLPAAAGHFIGRIAELTWLTGLPDHWGGATRAGSGGTVVISAIDGMAGIGKTALAVHAAHQLAERFPDGQLFIDLHGYTKDYPPREPDQALQWLLRALGVSAGQIPEDTEARAAIYRQHLADTRTLIVLDNALDEAQVRPLLPGAPGCLVLVTSRRRLKGLDDAHSLPLDLLSPQDAVALLRIVAGLDRIAVDDPLLGEVAELCGRVPLALRIVGALLRHRPAWGLEHMAGLLRSQHGQVFALSDGDRDLATVFGLSYTGLDEQHRLTFRRLGLVPGPDVDVYAAAALLECDRDAATGLLEDLVDHNLLIAHAPGRYRLHDLLRAHTRALADRDPVGERDAALSRLLLYYAHTAQIASVRIARYPRPAPHARVPAHAPDLTGTEPARAWLRTERDNLEAASAHAHATALDEHALALAAGLAEILLADGPFISALALHCSAAETAERRGWSAAHAAALTDLGIVRRLTADLPGADDALTRALAAHRAVGNRFGEAATLTELGRIRARIGDVSAAGKALTKALEIYCALDDRRGEAAVLTELGRERLVTGDLPGAAEAHTRALEIYRASDDRSGEANVLTNLAIARNAIGDLPGARDAFTQALAICRALSHRSGEAAALTGLAGVYRRAGDLPGAADAETQALEIFRACGNRNGEAVALTGLGIVRRLTGDLEGANEAQVLALEIFLETGNRSNEAWALNYHAAIVAAIGDLPRARALYQQALAMNRELNKPDDEAIALEGLGACHLAAGEIELAIADLGQALEIFERLGMAPDVERVCTRLANLDTA
jgi:DNA-binding SARP family transcriptional activator